MLSPPTWSIQALLPGLPPLAVKGREDIKIAGITHNSRDVKPGFLFVAVKGFAVDGHTFIPDALERGATCIILEDPAWIPSESLATFIQVDDSRLALAIAAANFFGNPSRRVTLIGITGTNGKTTLTYLLESILKKAGISSGVIGTINYRFDDRITEATTTTPDALFLQRTLSEMVSARVKTVVMEVSSHALSLRRVDGCHFDIAVWTNLSQDHLDFHASMDAYYEAKKTLFTHHLVASKKPEKRAIINLDDPYGHRLLVETPFLTHVTYGMTEEADIHPIRSHIDASGISAEIQTPQGRFSFTSPLIGHHNLMNLLATVATALTLKIPGHLITEGLRHATVPGRLEPVPNPFGITVLIDYAHTPDALKNVLQSLRGIAKGRIITVFGCGGDRDKKKRPMMGAIAERLSDSVILTSDNPRTEPPLAIIEQIEGGVKVLPPVTEEAFLNGARGYIKVPERKEAIHLAVRAASRNDIVLIAGKGHEPYQTIGTKKISFSDFQVAGEALSEKAGQQE